MTTKTIAATFGLCLCMLFATAIADKTAGERIDDSTIVAAVKTRLIGTIDGQAASINVESYKGVVALIGYTRSDADRKLALDTASKASGVEDVVDAILVEAERRSVGTTVDDQAIETRVKLKMTEFGADKVLSVITEVRNGEVLLGGFVKSDEVRDAMGEAAGAVKGVTKVHNRLAVKG